MGGYRNQWSQPVVVIVVRSDQSLLSVVVVAICCIFPENEVSCIMLTLSWLPSCVESGAVWYGSTEIPAF